MSSVGEQLRTHLINSTGVSSLFGSSNAMAAPGVVEQNTIRQEAPSPRIWYERASQVEEVDCNGDGGLVDSTWDIECHSEDIDEAINIADAVRSVLNGYYGNFGSTSSPTRAHGIFVEDHDDDYIPKGDASEGGLHVATLSVQMLLSST